jgi:hypothetical protein
MSKEELLGLIAEIQEASTELGYDEIANLVGKALDAAKEFIEKVD